MPLLAEVALSAASKLTAHLPDRLQSVLRAEARVRWRRAIRSERRIPHGRVSVYFEAIRDSSIPSRCAANQFLSWRARLPEAAMAVTSPASASS